MVDTKQINKMKRKENNNDISLTLMILWLLANRHVLLTQIHITLKDVFQGLQCFIFKHYLNPAFVITVP